jgi:hypothetical protein
MLNRCGATKSSLRVPCASLTCLAETYCRARSLAQLLYYRPKPKEYYYYLLYYARVNECELLHTGFLSHTLRVVPSNIYIQYLYKNAIV